MQLRRHALSEGDTAIEHARRLESISTAYPHGLLAIDKHVHFCQDLRFHWPIRTRSALMEIQEGASMSWRAAWPTQSPASTAWREPVGIPDVAGRISPDTNAGSKSDA